LFALEVILGSFAIRHLNAVVIASVVAAVTTQVLVGEERILTSPAYELDDPKQLLLFAALALFAVAFGLIFLKVSDLVRTARRRSPLPSWMLPIVAGVSVALIGIALPETLGTGQEFLQGLLHLEDAGGYVWWTLAAVALGKGVSNAITKTGGGSAGTFMPSLVIGGAVGAAFAILVDPLWGFSDMDPGAFAVVGMAATFAAVARAPLTSVVIVFEVTGDYGLVLPLMLGAALATFLGERFHPDSEYTAPLTRLGIHLPRTEDIDLLDTVKVGAVMSECDTVATEDMDLASLGLLLAQTRHHGVPVVDAGGRLAGMITVGDLEAAGGPRDDLTVAAAMSRRPITVTADQPVSSALARMAALDVGRMPVVAEDDPGRILGMFRRESVVRAYHDALGTATGRELYRERVRQRSDPGARFFEIQVRRGSPVAGQRVQDIGWPAGATLVSVRRGAAVLIPHGETLLEAGDTLTAFGTGTAREEFAVLVEPEEEPTGEWRHPLLSDDDGG
ncbi:MAG: CBS domain-containing protein, partial [Actinobacteria bacterium]